VPPSSTSSSRTLQLGDTRALRVWGLLLGGLLLLEAALHTPFGDRVPEASKWGNDRLARVVAAAEEYSKAGPLDVLVFGSSQGATWVRESDLRTRGLRAINASVPGGNSELASRIGTSFLLDLTRPRLVVITLGPLQMSAWNTHFIHAIEGSAVGGPTLSGNSVSLWIQQNVMLIRKGGQALNSTTLRTWRAALTGASAEPPAIEADAAAPGAREKQLEVYRSAAADEVQFEAIRLLRKAAEDRGAQVVFINMPVLDSAKEGARWGYSDYLSDVTRLAAGAPMLDLDPVAVDAVDFADAVHPLEAGKDRVAGPIGSFIEAQLAARPKTATPARQ
jgi:hypothetical protein